MHPPLHRDAPPPPPRFLPAGRSAEASLPLGRIARLRSLPGALTGFGTSALKVRSSCADLYQSPIFLRWTRLSTLFFRARPATPSTSTSPLRKTGLFTRCAKKNVARHTESKQARRIDFNAK